MSHDIMLFAEALARSFDKAAEDIAFGLARTVTPLDADELSMRHRREIYEDMASILRSAVDERKQLFAELEARIAKAPAGRPIVMDSDAPPPAKKD